MAPVKARAANYGRRATPPGERGEETRQTSGPVVHHAAPGTEGSSISSMVSSLPRFRQRQLREAGERHVRQVGFVPHAAHDTGALSASSGESQSGYISTLNVVLNVMDHIKPQHRRILPDSLKTQANEKLANAIQENSRTITKMSQLQALYKSRPPILAPA